MKKELYARPYMRLKRVLDLLLALLLSPLALLIVSLCYAGIKLESHGPAFFVQERPGYKGKIFRIYKLRTMSVETERNGVPLSDMERMTRMGRVIRACSFDELPQLYNILRGEMSFIGPRPLLARDVAYMDAQQHRRHEVRPGLTGLAQVMGRNALDWDTKLALDVSYVQRVTLAGDLKILFATVGKVVRREQVAFETEGYDMDLKDWNEMKAQKQRERETIQC